MNLLPVKDESNLSMIDFGNLYGYLDSSNVSLATAATLDDVEMANDAGLPWKKSSPEIVGLKSLTTNSFWTILPVEAAAVDEAAVDLLGGLALVLWENPPLLGVAGLESDLDGGLALLERSGFLKLASSINLKVFLLNGWSLTEIRALSVLAPSLGAGLAFLESWAFAVAVFRCFCCLGSGLAEAFASAILLVLVLILSMRFIKSDKNKALSFFWTDE